MIDEPFIWMKCRKITDGMRCLGLRYWYKIDFNNGCYNYWAEHVHDHHFYTGVNTVGDDDRDDYYDDDDDEYEDGEM